MGVIARVTVTQYLEDKGPKIQKYSKLYGVHGSSVAGVIGEEMRNVRSGESFLEWNALQSTYDVLKHFGGTFNSAVEAQYEMYRDDIENGRPITLFGSRYAAKVSGIILAQDIGPGNINFGESIRLLKRYNITYTNTDPLDIKKYNDDYELLYNDLRSTNSDATIKFAVMKVRDVTNNFNGNPIISSVFNSLDARGRDAAIDAGYRTSIGALVARVNRQESIYKPREGVYDYFYNSGSPYNYSPYKPR